MDSNGLKTHNKYDHITITHEMVLADVIRRTLRDKLLALEAPVGLELSLAMFSHIKIHRC